ncbi:DNA ligase (ATP) [Saccharomycopsis crataegensis]|uniref:DNA ligase 4 n=1 Tax=Saccharomycopsis crataegensis TaxID=43959 RepID=A0AAV5QHR2_9ASCO|nr:DNA ligase (ATP) [Saccharomycopsis crataegensis]
MGYDSHNNRNPRVFKFQELVDFFHRLSSVKRADNTGFDEFGKASVTERRRIIINEFLDSWKVFYKDNVPFYTILRMILPDRDRGRSYHVKEKSMSVMVAKMTGLSKDSDEYKRLFNGDLFSGQAKHGKLQKIASMMADIISIRQPDVKGAKYTVLEIDGILNQLDQRNSPSQQQQQQNTQSQSTQKFRSSQDQQRLLWEVFSNMNHQELKYMMLIILKSRFNGHSETAILRAWHPQAPEFFSVTSSLEAVCNRLLESVKLSTKELSVQLMQPFAPMLASHPKLSYQKVVESYEKSFDTYTKYLQKIDSNRPLPEFEGFYIEEKLDGERLQIHMSRIEGTSEFEFKFFSRRATDYSSDYGTSNDTGSLAKYFKKVIGEKHLSAIKNLILDGEVLSYDMKRDVVLPLGTLKPTNIETIHNSDTFRPLYVIFDILMINDNLVCNKPLKIRKDLLKNLIKPLHGYIELVDSHDGRTAEDIQHALQEAIESNSEGIVLKDKYKKYEVDARNESWVKVKPEYLQEFGADMDLCIIGKIPQIKTSYVCGLRVGEVDEINGNVYESFCSIANGISSADYEKIESLTAGCWKEYEKEVPPESLLQFALPSKNGPGRVPRFWIDPKDSAVLQIKARDIEYGLYGKRYKVGSTVLSGYMKAIRTDKDWRSSMSLEEFLAWKDRYKTHASKASDKLHTIEAKRARKTANNRKKLKLDEDYLKSVSMDSFLFEDMKFYVLSDYNSRETGRVEIDKIQELIKQNGGQICITEQPDLSKADRFIPLSSRNTHITNSFYKLGYDIISPSWVFDCIDSHRILLLEPRHCFKVSEEVLSSAEKRVDKYGDSFIGLLTNNQYKKLIDNLGQHQVDDSKITIEFQEETEHIDIDDKYPGGLLHDVMVHIVPLEKLLPTEEINSFEFLTNNLDLSLECLKLKYFMDIFEVDKIKRSIKSHGGGFTEDIDTATLIVVPQYLKKYNTDLNQFNEFREAIFEIYENNLQDEIKRIRKEIAKRITLVEGDISGKIPRVVNEKYISNSIEEECLLDAEHKLYQVGMP